MIIRSHITTLARCAGRGNHGRWVWWHRVAASCAVVSRGPLLSAPTDEDELGMIPVGGLQVNDGASRLQLTLFVAEAMVAQAPVQGGAADAE